MATQTEEELRALFQDALEMLGLTWQSFRRYEVAALERADALGRQIHAREKELTRRLVAPAEGAEGWRFLPAHLERIGDAVEGLVRCVRTMAREGTVFTERAVREVNTLFAQAVELLECARDLTVTGNRVLARHVTEGSARFHALADDFARAHEERLIQGVCLPQASSAYLAILDYLREVVRHTRRVAERLAPGPAG